MPGRLEQIARIYGPPQERLNELLDQSLDPRGPDTLLDIAAALVRPESLILDIGCRDGRHLIPIVQAHGCRGVGIDPVDWNLDRAFVAAAGLGLKDRIELVKGVVERIEQPDDHFDLVWCRDVLVLAEDLERGVAEIARVLKPDGRALVYTTVATELLEPREAARIHEPLANVARNLDEALLEGAFEIAALAVERKDVIGTEWREYEEERSQRVSTDLLRLARLRRRRAEIIAEFGSERFELAEASLQWRAYQFLGKLRPTVYLLRRAG